jgi:hypothetical protein
MLSQMIQKHKHLVSLQTNLINQNWVEGSVSVSNKCDVSFYRCNIQLYSIYYKIVLIKYNFHYSCLAKHDLSIETTRVYSFGKMMHVTSLVLKINLFSSLSKSTIKYIDCFMLSQMIQKHKHLVSLQSNLINQNSVEDSVSV